jgi:TatD DNase family protein
VLVDSHCHLQDPKFDGDRDAVIRRAEEAGVSAMVVIGYDVESSRRAIDIADSTPSVHATVGVHPHDAKTVKAKDIDTLARMADSSRVVGIGEIGLDFYRNLSTPEVQRRALQQQLDLARSLSLPVVIHSRNADEETYEILAGYEHEVLPDWPKDRPLGVMHCFGGDLQLALRYIEIGFVISIAGTCTYPNAERTRSVARGIPLRWMAVETDAPYLPPQSQRGRRNEPAYLAETVDYIADIRGDDAAEVVNGTALATARLFGLGDIGDVAASSAGERW